MADSSLCGENWIWRFFFFFFLFFFILEADNPHTGRQSECFDLGRWSRENPRKALLAAVLLEKLDSYRFLVVTIDLSSFAGEDESVRIALASLRRQDLVICITQLHRSLRSVDCLLYHVVTRQVKVGLRAVG